MAILRYIISILAVVLLTGCYEDFNPELDTTPVLCLNSMITAGEPIDVKVTHTWMVNDKQSSYSHDVKDARVTILVNERIVGSDYLPKEGDKIRIVADSPTYGTATAEVLVPYATPVEKVRVVPKVTNIRKNEGNSPASEMYTDVTFNLIVEMDVNDPAGTDNYYHFGYNWSSPHVEAESDDIWNYRDPSFQIGNFECNLEPIFKEHIGVFETVMGNDQSADFRFFTDRQFSGKTYTLHLNFTDNSFLIWGKDYDESLLDCELNLYLTTVSSSYYNWAVYKWYVDVGLLGDLSNIGLAESKWGYSNVSTGAGVVAAQSTSKYIINLKEFLKTTLNQ